MTVQTTRSRAAAPRQRGAVLFVALIFLLVLTLLAVMLARMETTEERMAENDANQDLALEAAGAALRFAQMNLRTGNPQYSDFAQNAGGLYTLDPTQGSWYSLINWQDPGTAVLTYGGLTPGTVSAPPEFIIEKLTGFGLKSGMTLGNGGYGGNGNAQVYQITAVATGADQTGSAALRSIYYMVE
jgi:type IV pilus assembly protein PilX